jgi:hypothetical protein
MKTIEFAEEHVADIQHGRKTATVRVGECEAIDLGDRVTLETEGGLEIEQAEITSAVETFVGAALHAIHVLDAEYPAESTADLVYGLRKHYGSEIDERTECRVLCWELTDEVLPDLDEIDAEGSA